MSFRADGTSVVRAGQDGEDVGVALAFSPTWAARISDALNESSTDLGQRSRKDPLTGGQVTVLDVRDRRPLSDVLETGQYVKIIGPYATAEMTTPGGRQIRSLAEGAVLPGDVTAGTARHLIDVGLAQLVEAASAVEAHEGAPSERHRVESAAMTGHGPTVGQPAEGTAAHDYDTDPVAAAQAAAAGPGVPVVTVLSGSGEAPLPESDADEQQPSGDGKPRGNASEATWREYHISQLEAQGMSEQDARADAEGLSRDDIRAQYK